MISIASGHSSGYLTDQVAAGRENYYTGAVSAGEPPGVWWGSGAEALGLTGLIDAQDMTALYEHRLDPRDQRFRQPAEWGHAPTLGGPLRRYATAEELYARMVAAEPDAAGERREELRLNAERSARSNVQFLDVTFSAPKSVTVLGVAFERQMVDALAEGDSAAADAWRTHRDAVETAVLAGNRAMLGYLQDVAGYSRVGHHGGTAGRFTDAHDWIVASFLQHDSRDRDPQLHVHNAVLNRVENSDGRWRTLATKALYAHRAAAGAIAERVMEEHLTRALGVRFVTRPDGKAREVVGVQPEVMDLFSSRRRAITAKTAAWLADFKANHGREPNALELDRLQRRATLATRRAKSSGGETAAERLDRWDAELRAEVAGGLASVARDALGLVQRAPEAGTWSPEIVIETALADVQAARSSWSESDLLAAVGRALPDNLGGLEPRQVRDLLVGLTREALQLPVVQQVAGERDEDLPVVPELLLADKTSAYADPAGAKYALAGQLVTEHELRRAAVRRGAPAVPDAQQVLAQIGVELSPSQQAALAGILESGAMVETLVGPAGTGKSTVVGVLARAWTDPETWTAPGSRDVRSARPRVVGLAVSQIATEVLRDEGLVARNVTQWLAAQQRLADGSIRSDDADWRLGAGDLVVIDEASMIAINELAAIHELAATAGAKLLLTGDHRQLAAVGAGGGMAMLAEAGAHELTSVHRFAVGWEGQASLRLRDGDEAALTDYRKHGRLLDGGTPEGARSSAARAWLADTLAGRQSVLVTGSNEEAALLSAEVRAGLVRLGRVEERGVQLGRDGTVAGVGDLVQARRNGWELLGWEGNSRVPINRAVLRVTEAHSDGSLVAEPVSGGPLVSLPNSYVFADLALGYAGTAHSVQGRTVDTSHVVVGAHTSPEALYVGMSRGRLANHAHVVTHPVDESQPAGSGRDVPRTDPLGVVARILGKDRGGAEDTALRQYEESVQRRRSVQTSVGRFAAEAEMVYTARTASTLDRLTATGDLTAEQRLEFAAETTDTGALARLLRAAELAGHDPDKALTDAVSARSLDGARSLPQVLYRRIERQLDGRLQPTALSYAEMIPAVASAAWQAQLRSRAEAADNRRRELGVETAQSFPQWAAEALGPVPADPVARLDWEDRAGRVAAWRELAGHGADADALGAAPRPGQPEHYAVWHAAWAALGRPEADRADAELSAGQLRLRIRAYERELVWAPAFVGESLTATSLAAEEQRRRAVLAAARAEAATGEERTRLHEESVDRDAVARALEGRVANLELADEARSSWLAHTAVTRDLAECAEAALASRGAAVAPDPVEALTAEQWLAAHRAEQVEGERWRPIAEVDVASDLTADLAVEAPYLETALGDPRERAAAEVVDEPGRVPEAEEARAAVVRAQDALQEIEQRRTSDERHAQEEERVAQLHWWAMDDAAVDANADVLS